MIVMLGLIFMNFFKGFRKKEEDIIAQYQRGFDLEAFKFSIAVIAPAIVLHASKNLQIITPEFAKY